MAETSETISVANLLSLSFMPICEALAKTLSVHLSQPVVPKQGVNFADVLSGEVELAFMCGLPYTLLHEGHSDRFEPLVGFGSCAPPQYFSELVIGKQVEASDLIGLRGRRIAYNEEVSFSGYLALELALKAQGLSWEHFSELRKSGSHLQSLAWVSSGEIDVAAVDSQVLALEISTDPTLLERISVIDRLGPYPSPPLVACTRSIRDRGHDLREALAVPGDAFACGTLFPTENSLYDPIRVAWRALDYEHSTLLSRFL